MFTGSKTPAHVTTVEYARDVTRVLRPGGLYLALSTFIGSVARVTD